MMATCTIFLLRSSMFGSRNCMVETSATKAKLMYPEMITKGNKKSPPIMLYEAFHLMRIMPEIAPLKKAISQQV